jgi:hypothetical protein
MDPALMLKNYNNPSSLKEKYPFPTIILSVTTIFCWDFF